ncbi:NADH-ubiquinone oxidoreductase subunit [Pseudohyphozyma bogoriensis]|nr:NADH-ubiquinone oxidoreductase subunit [Pseudohyphozyma bogoriensis]
MGGGHGDYHSVKFDPAVERWNFARENVWTKFRFTNRTARLALFWGAIVPFGVFTVCQQQDLKWDIQGVKRGEPLTRWAPLKPAAVSTEEDDE